MLNAVYLCFIILKTIIHLFAIDVAYYPATRLCLPFDSKLLLSFSKFINFRS